MRRSAGKPVEPHVREMPYSEPADLAARLLRRRHPTLLDSSMRHPKLGRYSYLSCDPSATLTVRRGKAFWNGKRIAVPALKALDRALAANRGAHIGGLPPFQGGFMGFLGYEFGLSLEPSAEVPGGFPDHPELILHFYDVVASFDHLSRRAFIVSTGLMGRDSAARADEFAEMLSAAPPPAGISSLGGWRPDFTRARYEAAVKRTVDYILAGDIFQANISQCFSAPVSEGFDAFAFYRRLRSLNPAPFSAFFDYGGLSVASSSPERLISFDGTYAEARPIKGTRPRHPVPRRDAALAAELLASSKDRAENVMIVDLLRNDLSRACDPGSVEVATLCGLETYASVHHLTSVVRGRLSADRTRGGLLAACFPGGSVTGAPKVRAMEIIGEIERRPRGVYCGSIGYIGASGPMDLNIAIRSVAFSGGTASFRGGGGITARSEPGAEYEETLQKVRLIREAFAP